MVDPRSLEPMPEVDWTSLALRIKTWGRELGFQQVGIADADLEAPNGAS